MDTNDAEQPKSRSLASDLAGGSLTGAAAGAMSSYFRKSGRAGKQAGAGALLGAAGGLAIHLLDSDKTPVHASAHGDIPTPPGVNYEAPAALALGQVPQLLEMLVARGQVTPEQQQKIINDIHTGRPGFSGEMVLADGFATGAQVGQALADQAILKSDAALSDINAISQHGTIPSQAVHANWGNNGVNPAPLQPIRIDGIIAAANIAQNLVVMANANPQLAPQLLDGAVAAVYLSRGIAQGDSALVPLAKMGETWRASMNQALTVAAEANPQLMTDANGKHVDVQAFIAARNVEITAGIVQALNAPRQNPSLGR